MHWLFHGDQPGGFIGNNIQDYGTGRSTNKNPGLSRKVPEHGIILSHSVTPRMIIRFSTKRVSIRRQKGPWTLNRILHSSFCRVTVNLTRASVGKAASSAVQSTTNMILTTVVRHSYPFAVIQSTEAKDTGMIGPLSQQRMMMEPPGRVPIPNAELHHPTCYWWCGGDDTKIFDQVIQFCDKQAYWSPVLSLHWVVLQYRLLCSLCHLTRSPVRCACQFGGRW